MELHTFNKETNGEWYVDLPDYPGAKADLQMVLGADTMLDIMAQGENVVRVTLGTEERGGLDALEFIRHEEAEGAWYLMKSYRGIEYNLEMWLCDVTAYVFNGEFPKTIWIG